MKQNGTRGMNCLCLALDECFATELDGNKMAVTGVKGSGAMHGCHVPFFFNSYFSCRRDAGLDVRGWWR